jgi:accessory gene regulator protein AgrB
MKVLDRFIIGDEADAEVILYGMKIIISHFISVMVVLVCALLLHSLDIAAIYLVTLLLLRRNVGGYHCKTYLGCLLTTTIAFMLIALTNIWFAQGVKEILGISFLLYSVIKIVNIKPIINKNRIVNETTIEKSNKKKTKYVSILIIVSTILHLLGRMGIINGYDYFYAISSSMLVIALSIEIITIGDERYERINE